MFWKPLQIPRAWILSAAMLLIGSGLRAQSAKALAIVGGEIESAEDGPPVPANYEFLPGDFLYFQFEVSGYKVEKTSEDSPGRIRLTYSVRAEDGSGTPLAPPQEQKIEDEITQQDKDWVPKRRDSILLPSYTAYGTCRVHLTVQDLIAKTEVERDYQFLLGGRKVTRSDSLKIQNVRFLRSDQDGPGLDVVDYRGGDTVWVRFDMTGFQVGPANVVELSYGVSVLRPDGKLIFQQERAATQKLAGLFYPPRVVPGELSVTTTPDLLHGEYSLIIRLRDRIGGKIAESVQRFQIE
jgi:hypothetical protein